MSSEQTDRGETALHVSRDRLEAHPDAIGRSHEVVTLSNLFLRNVVSERPRVALTFDDA